MAASKIYEIFIKNYKDSSGNFIAEETPMYSIPFDPQTVDSNRILNNPVIKTEMGKTGSFEFGLYPNNIYYSAWNQLKTIMRVTFDGETLFRGRVLTVDSSPFTGEEKIHCEGDLAFLMDSFQEGIKEEDREEITILQYLQNIINEHNRQMLEDGDPDKIMTLGEVPGQYSNAVYNEQKVVIQEQTFKYGESSYQSTMQRLESLLKQYGGYLRTRYEEETYVDTIGRYGEGNIDLNNRIVVHNADGSISTERSFSTNIDDVEVLLPTIVNGNILSEEAAISHYMTSGEYLGKFSTVEAAEDYALRLHERQDWYYNGQGKVKKVYLDWLDYCFRYDVNTQPIELGLNLIEMNGSTEVDNIFTAVVPIGKNEGKDLFIDGYRTDIHGEGNKRILVPQIVSLYTDAELNKGYHSKADYVNAVTQYGIIYKTQNFPNADTQEKLWNYCVDWIKENYAGGINTLTVRAVDLFHCPGYFDSGNPQKFLSGDRIMITYPDSANMSGGTITKTLTMLSVTYNLYNPEKNDFRIGIPNNQLNRTYGVSNKKGGGGGASGGIGDNNSEEERLRQEREARWSEYRTKAWSYIVDEQYNNDIYKELVEKHGENTVEKSLYMMNAVLSTGFAAANDDANKARFRRLYHSVVVDGTLHRLEFNDKVHVDLFENLSDEDIGKLDELMKTVVVDGLTKELGFRTTLGLVTSPDPSTWGEYSPLKMAMSLKPKKDETGEVKTEEAQLNLWDKAVELVSDAAPTLGLTGEDGGIGNILTKTGLDGTGDFATVITDGLTSLTSYLSPSSVITDPDNPTKTVEIDGDKGTENLGPVSGGQWKVKLNNTVTYYDESGHSHTLDGFVSADDFSIPNINSFKTKLAVIDQLIADRATIGELDAAIARIEDLETTRLKTADLASTIATISTLSVNNLNATAIGSTGPISGKTLSVNGTEYTYQAITFVTDVGVTMPSCSLSTAHDFRYQNASGQITSENGRLVKSYTAGSVDPTTKTIYVLGGIPSG